MKSTIQLFMLKLSCLVGLLVPVSGYSQYPRFDPWASNPPNARFYEPDLATDPICFDSDFLGNLGAKEALAFEGDLNTSQYTKIYIRKSPIDPNRDSTPTHWSFEVHIEPPIGLIRLVARVTLNPENCVDRVIVDRSMPIADLEGNVIIHSLHKLSVETLKFGKQRIHCSGREKTLCRK